MTEPTSVTARVMRVYRAIAGSGAKPLWQRLLLTSIHGSIALWRAARTDQLFVRAATLSYWTLVAIVPVLALAFAMMGPLGLLENVAVKLKEELYSTILASSVTEVGPWLDSIVSQVQLQALGVAGFLGVVLAGSKMYNSVEEAFNDIFRVRQRRSWLLRITLFYTVVTLGPLLLSAGYAATSSVHATVLSALLGRAVPVLLTMAAFVGAIKLLPHTLVRWRAALTGGFMGAILFEALKFGFSEYTALLGASSTNVRLYGSLALLPVFLLYVYLLWLVVLLGVEVAYVVNHARPLLAEEADRLRMGDIWRRRPDACFGLQVLVALAESFLAGKGQIHGDALVERLGAPARAVHEALDMLETAGFVVTTEGGGYVPAMPLEQLSGGRVIRACRAVSVPACGEEAPGNEAVVRAFDAISEALDESVAALAAAALPEPTESSEPAPTLGTQRARRTR
ncbi:MAG: YhjD/YihY/BrkB family envelope integrity protein [Pseudomonadota bacterium]